MRTSFQTKLFLFQVKTLFWVKTLFLFKVLALNVVFMLVSQSSLFAQQKASLKYRGQFSTWGSYATGPEWPMMAGARYLPQLNLDVPVGKARFDAELSGNIYGNLDLRPFYDAKGDGKIKLYRGWARLSSNRAELRVGLQKINFGSAMMLRPLMWFDSMDSRDPLQMTDGVWGALGRYYFANNTNIWVWGLVGNKSPRALDLLSSDPKQPEFGGRVQIPAGNGEIAITFHRRKTDNILINDQNRISDPYGLPLLESDLSMIALKPLYENRYGLDMRFDYEIGFWLEAVWISRLGAPKKLRNQRIMTVGADYTFGLGNGLGVTIEHMYIEKINITALNTTYPINMANTLSWIFYYDWNRGGVYNLLRWKRTLAFGDLYIMAFANPDQSVLPSGGSGSSGAYALSGIGLQIMLVINHQTK